MTFQEPHMFWKLYNKHQLSVVLISLLGVNKVLCTLREFELVIGIEKHVSDICINTYIWKVKLKNVGKIQKSMAPFFYKTNQYGWLRIRSSHVTLGRLRDQSLIMYLELWRLKFSHLVFMGLWAQPYSIMLLQGWECWTHVRIMWKI